MNVLISVLPSSFHLAWGMGDPHIVTLDGLQYTFNGRGEFTLLEMVDNSFTLQGRMEVATDSNGTAVSATVFSALVARQNDSDTVQLELGRQGVDVLINGDRINFEDLEVLPEQEFDNVVIVNHGNNTLAVVFSSGTYIMVREENEILAAIIISLPNSFKSRTRGLLGNYNGNISDDLFPKLGDDAIPPESTIQEIHESFGVTCELAVS